MKTISLLKIMDIGQNDAECKIPRIGGRWISLKKILLGNICQVNGLHVIVCRAKIGINAPAQVEIWASDIYSYLKIIQIPIAGILPEI